MVEGLKFTFERPVNTNIKTWYISVAVYPEQIFPVTSILAMASLTHGM
jgi:hypothetical protein